jgi:hypothetical protein
MSDAKDAFGFGKFVPGFDFLQSLAKGAPGMPQMPGMPGVPSWVAPTISVEELDKRIEELKAVQFWLDQNSTALKATLQALEVQKMTLATLKGMNFSMEDMTEAFRAKPASDPFAAFHKPVVPTGQQAEASPAAHTDFGKAPARKKPARKQATQSAAKAAAKGTGAGVVDPMQWWGALTQQFQQIATSAMKEVAQNAAASGVAVPGAATSPVKTGSRPASRKKPVRKTTGKTSRSRKAGA